MEIKDGLGFAYCKIFFPYLSCAEETLQESDWKLLAFVP